MLNNSKELIIGIDLGTHYSVCAVYRNGNPEIIPNDFGLSLTPSVMLFSDEMTCIAGNQALGYSLRFRDSIISEMKRVIGLKYSEISENVKKYFPFGLEEGENGKVKILIDLSNNFNKKKNKSGKNISLNSQQINGDTQIIKTKLDKKITPISDAQDLKGFYPENIVAQLLKNIKNCAQKYCNQLINKVVLTVPADFSVEQRESTKKAGELAGLKVVQLINEPTAAALAYIYYYKDYFNKEKKILIFDIGAGTCDITILRTLIYKGKIIIKILATVGDQNLGGKDFDNLLIEKYLNFNEFDKEKLKNKKNFILLHRLKIISERAKILLSTQNNVTLHLEKFLTQKFKDLEISREDFENLCENLFERCKNLVIKSLEEANLSSENIDDIILVGGSSRIQKIKSILQEIFKNSQIHDKINPDNIVALGASIVAGKKYNHNLNEFIIEDVVSKSLGIEVSPDKKFRILIPKNSTIPIENVKLLKTSVDYQKKILINIFEGEEETVDKNKKIGKFQIINIPPKKKGEVKINVFFRINENGILEVDAQEIDNEKNNNGIKIINSKLNLNNQLNLIQKIETIEPSITNKLIFYNKKISNAKNEEKFDLYLELINQIHSILNQDYLNNIKYDNNKIDIFILIIQFLFFQYSLLFSYKQLKNDDEITKKIKIHIFAYLNFIFENVADKSLLNVYEFIEDFNSNNYIKDFFTLFISKQFFEKGIKYINKFDTYEIGEEEKYEKKHKKIRKAEFFLNEGFSLLNYENVIKTILNVSEEITNYYENLKNEFQIYQIKSSIKEQITQGLVTISFMIKGDENKFISALEFVDNAYQIYLRNKNVLHQKNDKFFSKFDYLDLLKILNFKRIKNNLLKEFNEINDDEFNSNEKQLINEINDLKIDNILSKTTRKYNEDIYNIDNLFLLCKKENNFFKFIEFILNNYNYKNLNKDEINQCLFDFSNNNIDNLKLVYLHYDFEEEKYIYKIVLKIESYLNNIQNIIKMKKNKKNII